MNKLYLSCYGDNLRIVSGQKRKNDGLYKIRGIEELSFPGLISNTSIKKEFIIECADKLKLQLKAKKIITKNISVVIGGKGIIVRPIKVPKLSLSDLNRMLKMESGEYLMVSADEYAFQHKIISEYRENGQAFYEILLAALPHENIERIASLIECAGLQISCIDILPNSLLRLVNDLKLNDVMILNSGREGTSLGIYKDFSLFIYTDIPFKLTGDENNYLSLTDELRGYLDFYSSRNFGKTLELIIVTGEIAGMEDTLKLIEKNLNVPVNCGFKTKLTIECDTKNIDCSQGYYLYPDILGLMIRPEGE